MTERASQAKRELARALRDARRAAGLASQPAAVERLPFSQSTLSRIEKGRKVPSETELIALLDLYGSAHRAEVEALAARAREDTFDLDPNFQTLREREAVADRVRKFTSERIPTALQCSRYLLKQYELAGIPYDLDEVVSDHQGLVAHLRQERGPLVEVVMAHSSLLRMPGGDASVIGDQALLLLELLDTAPRLSLHLLMFSANVPYIDTDFTIVTGGGHPDMVYVQSGQDGFMISDKKKIQERERYWGVLQGAALSVEQTRTVLGKLVDRGTESLDDWFSIAK